MHNHSKLKFLLTPSLSSFFIATFLTGIVIADLIFASGGHNGLFYERFFGTESSPELIEAANTTWAAFAHTVFGNSLLNRILLVVFWMLVGFIVYVAISMTGSYTDGVMNMWHEMHYVHADSQDMERRLGLRIFVRSIAFLAWACYSLLFFSVLFPLALLCIRTSAINLNSWHAAAYMLFGVIELMVSMHLFTVLLRFTFLRPRLFGITYS